MIHLTHEELINLPRVEKIKLLSDMLEKRKTMITIMLSTNPSNRDMLQARIDNISDVEALITGDSVSDDLLIYMLYEISVENVNQYISHIDELYGCEGKHIKHYKYKAVPKNISSSKNYRKIIGINKGE